MRACNIISLTNSNNFDFSSVHIHQTNEDPARRGKGTGLTFVKFILKPSSLTFSLYAWFMRLWSILINTPGVE